MIKYGMKYATEFTKKQINVLYFKAKNGELKIEKWFMEKLYNLSEYYGYDDSKSVLNNEQDVLQILKEVFEKNTEKAQVLIDETQDKWYSLYGNKVKSQCHREIYVA